MLSGKAVVITAAHCTMAPVPLAQWLLAAKWRSEEKAYWSQRSGLVHPPKSNAWFMDNERVDKFLPTYLVNKKGIHDLEVPKLN